MKLPSVIKFNSHIGWDVRPNSSLELAFEESEVQVVGKSGTTLLFDGARLFHRGGFVEKGDRLVMQVVFSNETLLERLKNKLKR